MLAIRSLGRAVARTEPFCQAQLHCRIARNYSTATDPGQLVTLSSLSALASDIGSSSKYDEHITVLTLNRPSAKNAISRALASELEAHVTNLVASSDVRTVLIRSSVDGTFCAGADLKERKGMSKAEVDAFLLSLRRTFTAISKLPMPTIACLDGLAMGGGLELALSCDLRIAGPAATRLGLTEAKLGIIPGAGGTSRMTRLVGLAKAKELIFSARLVNATEASQIGFVDIVAEKGIEKQPGQEAFAKAVEVSRGFAKNGTYTQPNASMQTTQRRGLSARYTMCSRLCGTYLRDKHACVLCSNRPRYALKDTANTRSIFLQQVH